MEEKSSTKKQGNCVHVIQRCCVHVWIFLKTLKCLSGRVEFNFDNSAENFLPKLFARSPKITINLYFFQNMHFPSKCSAGHVQCSFDNPARIYFWFLFEKSWVFSQNCSGICHKISEGRKVAVECISNDFLSKKSLFHLNCEFLQKSKNY